MDSVGKAVKTPNGWLSPGGVFHECGWMSHGPVANQLDPEEGTAGLEKAGWVHTYDSACWTSLAKVVHMHGASFNKGVRYPKRLTAEQRNWLQLHGFTVFDED